MNYFSFIIKTALDDFRRNKLRTLLTSLGILIGVSSVVLLIAMGLGLKGYIKQQFESMGTNTIYVMPGNMIQGGTFQRSGPPQNLFDNKDVTSLFKIKKADLVVPFITKTAKVKGDKDTGIYEIAASNEDVFDIMNLEMEVGTPFQKSDVDKGAKKIVLGPKVAEKIFGSVENALGKIAMIENLGFKVIGVAKSKGGGGLGMPSVDEHVYMPYKAAYSFSQDKKFFAIYLKAQSQESIAQVKDEARKILLKRYSEDEFSVVEQTEFLEAINSIFTILNAILVAIAAISLIVGGVGIMNIMFVSVVERIREIGIRRTLGARRNDILYQFLAESVLLSVIGGAMAILLALGVVQMMKSLFPAYVDLTTVAVALGVSSLVGIVFGVMPARRAAGLSPIEAIRYE